MVMVLESGDSFETSFEREPGHARGWVNALRRRGMTEFRKQGFPTNKLEEWRTTNVAAIAKMGFAQGKLTMGEPAMELAQRYSFGEAAAAELVFVNGQFSQHLSSTRGLPKGVRAMG